MSGNFHPSKIEDEIYSIMDDYEIDMDSFQVGVIDAISDYLLNYAKTEYQLNCANWVDGSGGICAISFVEDGYPHLVMFNYWS